MVSRRVCTIDLNTTPVKLPDDRRIPASAVSINYEPSTIDAIISPLGLAVALSKPPFRDSRSAARVERP